MRLPKINISKENLLFGLLLLAVFIVGFSVTYVTLKYSKFFVKKTPNLANPIDNYTPVPVGTPMDISPQKGVFNVLLLGSGGTGHSGGGLTDSLIIVRVDTNLKKAALIAIPRDLWVPGNHKINAEASVNGIQNVGSVIKNVTGLPINYYVSVDFSGYSKIIDEQIHYEKGPANLDGASALKFVRSRHGDSDFGRSARQFAVLSGIERKLISLHALDKTNKTMETLSKMIRTDLNLSTIRSLIDVFGDPGAYSVKEIQLTTENILNEGKSGDGQYILTPKSGNFNFNGVKTYISSQIN